MAFLPLTVAEEGPRPAWRFPRARALAAGRWPSRLGFTLLVCLVASTQLLFQPSLFGYWSAREVALGWMDYLIECLCYGTGALAGAAVGERLMPRLRRGPGVIVLLLLIAIGTIAGGAVSNLNYGVSRDYMLTTRFIADTVYWFAIAAFVVLIYALQRRAALASTRLHRAQVDRVALQKQTLEAQLQLMRAQIEPHFLFNTLANAKRLCQTDVDRGLSMLDNLIIYLRAALPQMRDTAATTLGKEVDLVHAYVEVLAIRMGARLKFQFDVPAELCARQFPPMMLLTLVENAIKHGLNPSPDGGTIDVRARLDRGDLIVAVADTGVGFGAAATGGAGIGLANTRARLAAIFGPRADLSLATNTPSGVIATIRVPDNPSSTLAAA